MSREKQIEEMAKDLETVCGCVRNEDKAGALYDTFGWRKQSEGEWEDANDGKYANPIYRCSVCQKGTLLKPDVNELGNMSMIQALSPFCPHCGAKMKGGAEG